MFNDPREHSETSKHSDSNWAVWWTKACPVEGVDYQAAYETYFVFHSDQKKGSRMQKLVKN